MFKLKLSNAKTTQIYMQKLKDFKTWAQVKSPKSIRPALSYTLGWLSPELLGTGFRMIEVSDFEMKALIPADAANKDGSGQIHQGLVLNAVLELATTFTHRHMETSFYHVESSEVKISKKLKWNEGLALHVTKTDSEFDDFFSELQKNKKAQLSFRVSIEVGERKKTDTVDVKLICVPTPLLTS
ncbi:MAG: hypothetical protein A2622_06465 [Bdellovibrionales bacterium RIFCSPHIGHO2_01_FULL_40_29]|nr:MAG: hypothetical protein A2622_06465 [Bdellovibrionales bacterium RIFCSPHIGHO2_01_FULL_40_29]OFZ35086.1 MAG: hypothetical protein A3D17_06815 [Bdellovibrionales bacterium RIFCSPHIGHO2_02_FULL_40_15]